LGNGKEKKNETQYPSSGWNGVVPGPGKPQEKLTVHPTGKLEAKPM
jgi:hypothetical protein